MDKTKIKNALDSFLDSKVSQLNTNQKLLVCAATVLIPIVAFYFLYYSPKSESISALERNIASLKKELIKVKGYAAKLGEQKALMKKVDEQFKKASLVIPEKKEIPSLLTSISSQATGAGLDILSFKPSGERPKRFYAEIPVSLSVTGSYHNVGHFLDTVSKLPRIVNVDSIKLNSPKMQGGQMLLRSSINLVTYRFIEPKKTGTKKKRGRKR